MSAFDIPDNSKRRKSKTGCGGALFNFAAFCLLLTAIGLAGYFVYTFIYPDNPYNPFPPVTQAAGDLPLSSTLAPSQTPILVATWTSTPTLADTAEPTAVEDTPLPSFSPTLEPSPTPIPHFRAQDGTPVYAPYPNGCDGIYLVGNVVDADGNPLVGVIVQAGGLLDGDILGLAPSASGIDTDFSPSGWMIKLSDSLVASTGSVFVALVDASTDTVISDLVYFDTYDDCDHNMIMVNFVQQP